MLRWKKDILTRLKASGFNTVRIKKENLFGQKTVQDFRTGAEIPFKTLNKLCAILDCKPWDIIEYIPDEKNNEPQTKD